RRDRRQHGLSIAFEQAVGGVGGQQRLHFGMQRGIAGGQCAQVVLLLRRGQVDPCVEQRERLPHALVGAHVAASSSMSPPPISRYRNARALRHSRRTVRSVTSSIEAISVSLMPPK